MRSLWCRAQEAQHCGTGDIQACNDSLHVQRKGEDAGRDGDDQNQVVAASPIFEDGEVEIDVTWSKGSISEITMTI